MIRFVTVVAYFGISEGVWGASIGKRLLGLRVVMTGGGQPPGVIRAIARVLIFELPTFIQSAVMSVVQGMMVVPLSNESARLFVALDAALSLGLLALLFATARHRNGFAAIHDLWSGTRVVHPVAQIQRPALDPAPESSTTSITPPRRLGPFDVIDTIGRTDVGTLLLGFDSRLRRRVWLHELPVG